MPWPLNDGGNLATFHVTQRLTARGHQVTLASLNTQKHYVKPSDFPEVADFHPYDIDTSITGKGLLKGVVSSKPYNVMRFWDEGFAELLGKLCEEKGFDLIQLEGSYLALYIPTLRRKTEAPIILRSHNVEHQIWSRMANSMSAGPKRMFFKNLAPKIKRFEEETLQGFDGVVAITDGDREWYQNQGFKGKLTTINAGVDFSGLPDFSQPENLKSICFIGSLEWMPNVQGVKWFLEKVWPKVHAQFPEVKFHLAGKNPPEELKELQVPGMVFHGMVPDAYEFLQAHGILVTPLFSGGGMRLKVVEAMGLGKCIVSTTVGAEGVQYEAGTDLMIADTPDAFVEELGKLLNHPEKIAKTGENALKKAKEYYDWDRLVDKFEVFYREILAAQ